MIALVGYNFTVRMNPGAIHGLAYFPAMTAQISCLAAFAVPLGGVVGLTAMSTVFINKSGPGQQSPKDRMMWAFIAMIPTMWFCVLLTTFLGNVWVHGGGGHGVVNGGYLWSLLNGNSLKRERATRDDASQPLAPMYAQIKDSNNFEAALENPTTMTSGYNHGY